MIQKGLSALAVIMTAFFAVGCGGSEKNFNILDAAHIYAVHSETFSSIRKHYPGPYREFVRIPSRDPSKVTDRNKEFLAALREKFDVEYIDFFPLGETGNDEVDVILSRRLLTDRRNTISLIYVDAPIPEPSIPNGVAVFDACDERSTTWLEQNTAEEPGSVFCRINQFWYAFQRID